MSKPSDTDSRESLRQQIIGLGDKSVRKNYYPQLQEKLRLLEEKEQRYKALFDLTFQLCVILEPDGTLTSANRSALELMGAETDEVVGRNFTETPLWSHSPDSKECLRRGIKEASEGRFVRFDVHCPDATGELHYLDFSLKPVRDSAGEVSYLIAEGRDMTGYELASQQLVQLKDLYRALSGVNNAIIHIRDVEQLLQEACKIAASLDGVKLAWIGFAADPQSCIQPLTWAGEALPAMMEVCVRDDSTEKNDRVDGGEPRVVADIEAEPGIESWREAMHEHGLNAFATFPLQGGSLESGLFVVYAEDAGYFQGGVVGLFEEMSANLGFALGNLKREEQRRTAEAKVQRLAREEEVRNKLLRLGLEDQSLELFLSRFIDQLLDAPWLETLPQAAVFLLAPGGQELTLAAAHRFSEQHLMECHRVPFGRCLCGQVATSREALFCARCECHPESLAAHGEGHFHHVLPLQTGETFLGVLNLYLPEQYQRDDERENFLLTVADILAVGISRKQADLQIHEHDRLLVQVIDSMPLPIFYKDADLVYQGCNASFARDILGHEPDEIIGKTMYDIAPPDLAEIYHQSDRKLLAEGGTQVYETEIEYADGIRHMGVFHKAVITDEEGGATAIVGAFLDLTEHQKLEEQLRHAQKVEALGTLTGGIAHDFNNLLTAIMGYASILQLKLEKGSDLADMVGQIIDTTDKAAKLTYSLLTFSRKKVSNPQPVDLNDVVLGIEKILSRIIRESIDFKIELERYPLIVQADEAQLEQVLVNLATNARDAMPSGGRLNMTCRRFEMDDDFIRRHGFGESGSYALLTVSDTGCGISEELRAKIFDPFFTTKEVGRGTGLGLSITYGIINQHQGHVRLESEEGVGTTMYVYLPLSPDQLEAEAMEEQEWPQGGKETILLVEDDEMVATATRILLEEFGYRVILATDGEDALQLYTERMGEIDLVLTDVIMPRKNGLQLAIDLENLNPDLKILFTSGYTFDALEDHGIKEGEVEIIFKPVAPVELLQKVRLLLGSGSGDHYSI